MAIDVTSDWTMDMWNGTCHDMSINKYAAVGTGNQHLIKHVNATIGCQKYEETGPWAQLVMFLFSLHLLPLEMKFYDVSSLWH